MKMIKFVLPRTMMVSKIKGKNSVFGLYEGCHIKTIVIPRCDNNIVIYLDDIKEDEHEKAAD